MSKLENNQTQIDLDLTWIQNFGHPYRDAEQLSWVGLQFNEKTLEIEPISTLRGSRQDG